MYNYAINTETGLIEQLREGKIVESFKEVGLIVSTIRMCDAIYCSVLKHGEADRIEQLLSEYERDSTMSLIRISAEEVDPERLTHFINSSVQPLAILNQLRLVRTQ